MDIGVRIREVREDLGMPGAVLARRVGVAKNTIWRIERGERTPSVALLEKIARELRTEPADLLREPAELLPKVDVPRTGHQQIGDEPEEVLAPTLHYVNGAFDALMRELRTAGAGDESLREAEELRQRTVELLTAGGHTNG